MYKESLKYLEDEYHHLLALQEKINTYISFLEEKQYNEIYKEDDIEYGIIEIHFLYNITSNAEKFLQSVQNVVAELGIKI
ncbi:MULTISPECIES: DUF6572 domain-containing protein [Roseburia]|uniref:DUF6572 domain-containing protein n=1 Tax=Roseburia TaxID=841 RepID=UPI002FE5A667